YVLGAAGGGGFLVSLAVTLWAAGAFGGGEENPQVVCSPCPTVGRTPGPTSTVSSTPTPSCCSPTLAPTFAPTEAPTEPPPPPALRPCTETYLTASVAAETKKACSPPRFRRTSLMITASTSTTPRTEPAVCRRCSRASRPRQPAWTLAARRASSKCPTSPPTITAGACSSARTAISTCRPATAAARAIRRRTARIQTPYWGRCCA